MTILTILGGLIVAVLLGLGVIKALELVRNRIQNNTSEGDKE